MEKIRPQQRQAPAAGALTLEVQIQGNHQACWQYAWERDQSRLRLESFQPAQTDLPADLALLHLENQRKVPVAVCTPVSIAPGTRLTVRVLGACAPSSALEAQDHAFPLAGWLLLAVPMLAGFSPEYKTVADLPSELLQVLRQHVASQQAIPDQPTQVCSPERIAQRLREARLWLKRARRQHTHSWHVAPSTEAAPAVAWRTVEGLTPEQRAQMARAQTIAQLASLVQAEQLIHFVPQRFQHALEQVLAEDERLLLFLERPLLRQRTGWLGLQSLRANAGLFLVTDQQMLWLRDFFSPGSSSFPAGYIAHSLPLGRLTSVSLVSPEKSSSSRNSAREQKHSPYPRLVLEIASAHGQENFDLAFPAEEASEAAIARLIPLLRAFVPLAGEQERHLCRLPVVDTWLPQGEQARRLAALGGLVPPELTQALEQRLAEELQRTGESLLVSIAIPALEEYRSPARLVALTRQALLLCDAPTRRAPRHRLAIHEVTVQAQRYSLAEISSVQISYSLFGSQFRVLLPQPRGTVQHLDIPFHSPALVRFLPLFTRLRLLLNAPPGMQNYPAAFLDGVTHTTPSE